MKSKTILRIIGARPQIMQVPSFLNMVLEKDHEHFLLHTGQHYDFEMSQVFLNELGINTVHKNLEVGSGTHGQMTGRMIEKIENVILEVKPKFVVVDGDTNTTMASALASVKLGCPVVHLEAGTRDLDRKRPEEINRIVTDHVAEVNFAPIPLAFENLQKENLGHRSYLTGDFLLDTFKLYEKKADHQVFKKLNVNEAGYNLMTLHRPENVDPEAFLHFEKIVRFVESLDIPTLFPVHPRTKSALNRYEDIHGKLKKIFCIPPVSYFEMRALLEHCEVVFTDSGGLPREAVWSGKKCLMFFKYDTWHDLLNKDWAQIWKGNGEVHEVYGRLKSPDSKETQKFFGNGDAATKAGEILNKLGFL